MFLLEIEESLLIKRNKHKVNKNISSAPFSSFNKI